MKNLQARYGPYAASRAGDLVRTADRPRQRQPLTTHIGLATHDFVGARSAASRAGRVPSSLRALEKACRSVLFEQLSRRNVRVRERTGDGSETEVTGLPRYAPMLATAGVVPHDDARWNYEVKFDGIRAICYVSDGLRLMSRNDKDITAAWPELAALGPSSPAFVVDGEIVALAEDGRSSFEALQPRMHQRNPAMIRSLATTTPATYMIFDLLHVGDRSLIDLPYRQRRELLEQLDLRGPHWQTPPRLQGPGAAVLDESRRLRLEGIVCKRLDGPYLPGRRSPLWIKVKNVRDQEVVIVGWRPGAGQRAGHIGSLLMAVHDDTGELTYIGNVGTGFTQATLDDLSAKLQPLQRNTPSVAARVPDAVWVEPELVGEVTFTGWTSDARLRHPSWRGLRFDKNPLEVRREP